MFSIDQRLQKKYLFYVMEKEERLEYPVINILRFIFALLVVAIHFAPLSSEYAFANNLIQKYIARLAVPFFFTTSGYFVAKSAESPSNGGG